jgi:hypothetical protein
VQAARDEQPTPLKRLTLAPAGFGVRWTLHRPSFHRSTNVTPTFEAVSRVPTPMHEEALVQVPNKSSPFRALGFGDGVINHPEREATAACASEPRAPV